MNNKNFHFLIKVANLLEKDIDTCGLANQIENLLKEIAPVKALSLYVFDSVTGTIRNCVADWSVIEDESEIYNIFDKIKGEDFIIIGYINKEESHVISLVLGEYLNKKIVYVGKVILGKKRSLADKILKMKKSILLQKNLSL